jgi:hypothetical protein
LKLQIDCGSDPVPKSAEQVGEVTNAP